MENQISPNRTLLTFLVGGALGVGAGLLVSKALTMRQSLEGKAKDDQAPSSHYCAVPEGADICFPET